MTLPPITALLTLTVLLLGTTAGRSEPRAAAPQVKGPHPAVRAFFDSKDSFVQEVVLPNIEANRKCAAVLIWSNYDKFTGNPLFSEDGTPNEKYKAIQSLLQDKLTTRATGKTNPAGRFSFRGFHGAHEFTITLPSGKQATAHAKISGDATELRLVVDDKAGTLREASP